MRRTRGSGWRGAGWGLVAGVVMGLWAIARALAWGEPAAHPVLLVAATVYGPDALGDGSLVILVGLFLHLATAAFWGALFGRLTPGLSWRLAAVVGPIYGLVVLAGMTFLVLPHVDPVLRARVPGLPVAWLIGHLLFGAALALGPALVRRRRPEAIAPPASEPVTG